MTDQSERAIGRVADMRRYLETIIFVLEERIMIRTDDFHYEMWKEAHRDLEEPEPSQKSFEWKMTAFEADHFAYLTATKGIPVTSNIAGCLATNSSPKTLFLILLVRP